MSYMVMTYVDMVHIGMAYKFMAPYSYGPIWLLPHIVMARRGTAWRGAMRSGVEWFGVGAATRGVPSTAAMTISGHNYIGP